MTNALKNTIWNALKAQGLLDDGMCVASCWTEHDDYDDTETIGASIVAQQLQGMPEDWPVIAYAYCMKHAPEESLQVEWQ